MTTIIQTLKTLILATILSLGISFAYAWTEPTEAPTGGNTSAPLNTSSATQSKGGGLRVEKTLLLPRIDGIQSLETYGTTLLSTVTGNVGIGTGSPGARLEVAAPASGKTVQLGNIYIDTTNPNHIKNDSNLTLNAVGASTVMTFNTVNAERMRIDSTGNVGIGTTGPSQKLDVAGTVKSQGLILSGNADQVIYNDTKNSSNNSAFYFTPSAATANSYIIANGSSATTRGNILASYGSGWTGNYTNIYHDGTDGYINSSSGDLILSSVSGNVGIGTTAPQSKLSVGGSGHADYAIYGTGASYGIFGSGTTYGIYGSGGTNGVYGYGSSYGVVGSGGARGVYASNNSNTGYALYAEQNNSSGYGVYSSGGKNYFSGKVGIGTGMTSPGAKLDIASDSGSKFINFKDTSGNFIGSIENNSSKLKMTGYISKDLELGANTQTRLTISGTDGGVSISNGLNVTDGLKVTYSSSPVYLTYSGYNSTSLKANCSSGEVATIKQCWATKTSGVSYVVWSGLCSCSSYRPNFWADSILDNTVYYQWRPLGNGVWNE